MSIPYISVVVPTNRVGGIDVLLSGLLAQTFRDFELVLVDGVALEVPRLPVVDHSGFRIRSVRMADGLRTCSYCRYANAGLAAARGEVVLMLSDYTQLPPRSLQTHAEYHQRGGRGLMCSHDYFKLPPLSPAFGPYTGQRLTSAGHDEIASGADWARYVADMQAGKLDALLHSVLANQADLPAPEAPAAPCDAGWHGADPKLRMPPGPIPHTYFHCKHESFRREDALAIGGFDERLDGTNGYQDTDFAHRLTALRGVHWTLDPSQVARIFNPRPHFPHPPYARPIASNRAIYEQSVAEGFRGVRSRFTEDTDAQVRT